jgi:hypothetical protein
LEVFENRIVEPADKQLITFKTEEYQKQLFSQIQANQAKLLTLEVGVPL